MREMKPIHFLPYKIWIYKKLFVPSDLPSLSHLSSMKDLHVYLVSTLHSADIIRIVPKNVTKSALIGLLLNGWKGVLYVLALSSCSLLKTQVRKEPGNICEKSCQLPACYHVTIYMVMSDTPTLAINVTWFNKLPWDISSSYLQLILLVILKASIVMLHFKMHCIEVNLRACKVRWTSQPHKTKYRRTGFNCENLIIANCEFF